MLDLPLEGPLMNAAGTLGFAPGPYNAGFLDGFVTNPVSLRPRTPAHGPRILPHPGGHLLHTGHPNPGLSAVIRQFGPKWRRSKCPVFVHLLADTPDEVYAMVRRLEEIEGVMGVELGMPPACSPDFVHAAVQAAIGELPVIVRVGLEDLPGLAVEVREAGASALSFGAPRGSLPGPNGAAMDGRMYGRSIYPLALNQLRGMPSGIDVLFSGGVSSREEMKTAIGLGAAAVQLDLVLWKVGADLSFIGP